MDIVYVHICLSMPQPGTKPLHIEIEYTFRARISKCYESIASCRQKKIMRMSYLPHTQLYKFSAYEQFRLHNINLARKTPPINVVQFQAATNHDGKPDDGAPTPHSRPFASSVQ